MTTEEVAKKVNCENLSLKNKSNEKDKNSGVLEEEFQK